MLDLVLKRPAMIVWGLLAVPLSTVLAPPFNALFLIFPITLVLSLPKLYASEGEFPKAAHFAVLATGVWLGALVACRFTYPDWEGAAAAVFIAALVTVPITVPVANYIRKTQSAYEAQLRETERG